MSRAQDTPAIERQRRMIDALRHARAYDHPVGTVELCETHISWILLAGEFAYKIKKALDAGFLDYRSLEARRFYCEEEVRLDRRGAPDIYLGVTTVSGPAERARFGGHGEAIDYAVRMARFAQQALLSERLRGARFDAGLAGRLADRVASFHRGLPALPAASPHGSPAATRAASARLLRSIEALGAEAPWLQGWEKARDWLVDEGERLDAQFAARRQAGMVRECHGDLHCANIVVLGEDIALFDGIEFSEELRSIDVANDLAFLLMDLQARRRPEMAWHCLNRYLELSGDYEALGVLRYYIVYRALVRCMVESLRALQQPAEAAVASVHAANYLRLARAHRPRGKGAIVLTHGFSGSGKSTLALAFCRRFGAIRLRSDVERARLWGHRGEAGARYSAEATEATYARLATLAAGAARAGWVAVVDATFLARAQRDRFRALARELACRFAIVDFAAPAELLRARVRQRQDAGSDVSEADVAVLERQLRSAEPLAAEELADLVRYDATRPLGAADTDAAWAGLNRRLRAKR